MKKVSITIHSIYPQKLKNTLDSIEKFTENVDYEIVIVGPKEIEPVLIGRKNIKFILEVEQKGGVIAQQTAFEFSTGEYNVWLADDVIVTKNWLVNMLKFIEANDNGKPLCGSFRMKNASGEEIPQGYIQIHPKINKKILYAMHGCVKTSTLKKLGCWARGYRQYYIDPDFGMRIWSAKGRTLVCPDAWIIHLVEFRDELWYEKVKNVAPEDRKLFYKYWRKTLLLEKIKTSEYWLKGIFIEDIERKIKNFI